jgi:hypothetical protein
MTQWNERFKDHAVWQTIQALGPAIDQALAKESSDPATLEMLSRLKAVQIFVGRRMAAVDRYLLTPAPLDALNGALAAFTTEVRHFIANGNPGHLTNANAQADALLGHLAQLNYQTTPEDFQAAKEAADLYRQSLDTAIASARTGSVQSRAELDALRLRLGELTAQIESEKTRLTTVATEFQSQFSTSQEGRNADFLVGQQQRLDNSTRLFTEYTQKLSDQNADFTKQREEVVRAHKNELADLNRQFVEGANVIRDHILARKTEVEKLVGVIGNLGVTSGYQKSANTAVFTARVWQAITVSALMGLIGIAYVAFLPLVRGDFTWSGLAGRVFVSLTVAVLAAYSASQADRYQKLERNNRRLALELEAIGPYIAPLPKEKQEQFLLTVGDRSFGQPDELYLGPHTKSPATILDVFLHSKEFRSLVVDIVKAAKS